MHEKTLAELSAALRDREVSSVELTQHMLQRIKAHDGDLNSYISVTEEGALAQAAAADERLRQNRRRADELRVLLAADAKDHDEHFERAWDVEDLAADVREEEREERRGEG